MPWQRIKISGAVGLRGRLILLLTAAFATLSILTTFHLSYQTRLRIKSATAELIADAKLIAARQDALVERADAILNGLILPNEQAQINDPAGCMQFLADRLRREPEFLQLAEARLNGDALCAATPFSSPLNVADRPYFQQTLQAHQMILADVVVGRILGGPVIIFGRAIRDANDGVTGALFIMLALNWLQQEIAGIQLPESSRLAVLDASGAVVVRYPDPEAWSGKVVSKVPILEHALRTGDSGAGEAPDLGGELRLIAYTPLFKTAAGAKYTLFISVPEYIIAAPARREALVSLAIILGVLLVTIGFVLAGTNRLFLNPIMALSETAARLKAGDLQARSGLPHSDNELGRLAETLDQTAAAIEDREQRLRVAAEEMRVARDRAEQASRAKTAFLNMVSHELRTPLTQLELQLALHRRLFQDALNQKQNDVLCHVSTAMKRLTTLVNSVLEYSSIQSGSLNIRPQRFDMVQLMTEAYSEVEAAANQRGLQLVFTTDGSIPMPVSDPVLVRMIVHNLLENAIKYTAQGKISVHLNGSSTALSIQIADTGPGISTELQEKMFDPFEQGEDVSKKHLPGVGLGLALVRDVTQLLGGQISFRPNIGGGSIFTLLLPLTPGDT